MTARRLRAVPERSLVTSHTPADGDAMLYWVLGQNVTTTTVRSVASGEFYDWPNERMVEVR